MKNSSIAHLTTTSGLGGAEHLILSMMCQQAKDFPGYDLIVIVIGPTGALNSKLNEQGIKNYSLDLRNIFEIPLAFFKLYGLVKRYDIKLLHTHLYQGGTFGALLKFFIPTLLVIHTRHYLDSYSKILKYFHRHFITVHLINKKSDQLVAISEEVKKVLLNEKVSEDSILIIENGVKNQGVYDPTPEEQKLKADLMKKVRAYRSKNPKGLVAYNVGMFRKHKGHENLLSLLKYTLENNCPFFLILIGDGERMQEHQNFCIEHKLVQYVFFLGAQEGPYFFIDDCDLFLHLPTAEGFGLVVCEAMRERKIVLAAKVGGIKNIIDDGVDGVLVDPVNIDEQFKRLQEIASFSEGKHAEMVDRAFGKYQQQYTIEICQKKYTNLYKKFL